MGKVAFKNAILKFVFYFFQILPIFSRFKKCIRQVNVANFLHIRIRRKFAINIKKDRHVNRFARSQSLLFEAKALNFVKIRRRHFRQNIIRAYAANGTGGKILCAIKNERRFARPHVNEGRGRRKRPWKTRMHVGQQMNAQFAAGCAERLHFVRLEHWQWGIGRWMGRQLEPFPQWRRKRRVETFRVWRFGRAAEACGAAQRWICGRRQLSHAKNGKNGGEDVADGVLHFIRLRSAHLLLGACICDNFAFKWNLLLLRGISHYTACIK